MYTAARALFFNARPSAKIGYNLICSCLCTTHNYKDVYYWSSPGPRKTEGVTISMTTVQYKPLHIMFKSGKLVFVHE